MSDKSAYRSPDEDAAQAARRLREPDDFEDCIDALREWRRYNPTLKFASVSTRFAQNMSSDVSNKDSAKWLRDCAIASRVSRLERSLKKLMSEDIVAAERLFGIED